MKKDPLKIFKLELYLSNSQLVNVTINLSLETSNGEDNVVPGFEDLWYSLDVNFEPALKINKTGENNIPIALPGKSPNGEIVNLTLGHVAQAIAITLKDKFNLDVLDLREYKQEGI
jgi:hypothetical protein